MGLYKTVREVYLDILTELVKEESPTLYLEDFIYYYNKAISEYMKLRYEKFELTQQITDDMRTWKMVHNSSDLVISINSIGGVSVEAKEACRLYGEKTYDDNKETLDHDPYGEYAQNCKEESYEASINSVEYAKCILDEYDQNDPTMSACVQAGRSKCSKGCDDNINSPEGFRFECDKDKKVCMGSCMDMTGSSFGACMAECNLKADQCIRDHVTRCKHDCENSAIIECSIINDDRLSKKCRKAPYEAHLEKCEEAAKEDAKAKFIAQYTERCMDSKFLGYRHLLSCIIEVQLLRPVKHCSQPVGTTKKYKVTRSTSARNAGLVDNVYLDPQFFRPYFDIKGDIITIDVGDINPKWIKISNIQIEYLKQPTEVTLNESDLITDEDGSQVLEFPTDVSDEVTKRALLLILERSKDPRMQTHMGVNQTVNDISLGGGGK